MVLVYSLNCLLISCVRFRCLVVRLSVPLHPHSERSDLISQVVSMIDPSSFLEYSLDLVPLKVSTKLDSLLNEVIHVL